MNLFQSRTGFSWQTRNDRLGLVVVSALTIIAMGAGLLIKEQSTNDTWLFESRSAGVVARYPAGWIVDEGSGAVARISDPRSRPFKTQYSISSFPFSGQTSIRNILDGITLQRSSDLAGYRVLEVFDAFVLGRNITRMRFAFVVADPNPFIQQIPVVVLGEDTVIVDGNRALVITYENFEQRFDADRASYDRFYASIRY